MTHKEINDHIIAIQEHFKTNHTIQEFLYSYEFPDLNRYGDDNDERYHLLGILRDSYVETLNLPKKKYLPIVAVSRLLQFELTRRVDSSFGYSIHYNNEDVTVRTTDSDEPICLTKTLEG